MDAGPGEPVAKELWMIVRSKKLPAETSTPAASTVGKLKVGGIGLGTCPMAITTVLQDQVPVPHGANAMSLSDRFGVGPGRHRRHAVDLLEALPAIDAGARAGVLVFGHTEVPLL